MRAGTTPPGHPGTPSAWQGWSSGLGEGGAHSRPLPTPKTSLLPSGGRTRVTGTPRGAGVQGPGAPSAWRQACPRDRERAALSSLSSRLRLRRRLRLRLSLRLRSPLGMWLRPRLRVVSAWLAEWEPIRGAPLGRSKGAGSGLACRLPSQPRRALSSSVPTASPCLGSSGEPAGAASAPGRTHCKGSRGWSALQPWRALWWAPNAGTVPVRKPRREYPLGHWHEAAPVPPCTWTAPLRGAPSSAGLDHGKR